MFVLFSDMPITWLSNSDISELCELIYQVLWTSVLIYRNVFNFIINALIYFDNFPFKLGRDVVF